MHDCEKCFWTYHKGYEWEQASSVQERTRKELCSQLQLKHVRVPEGYGEGALYGLGEHEQLGCVSKLAEGGVKCWFSAIFLLLVGQKSGKNCFDSLIFGDVQSFTKLGFRQKEKRPRFETNTQSRWSPNEGTRF